MNVYYEVMSPVCDVEKRKLIDSNVQTTCNVAYGQIYGCMWNVLVLIVTDTANNLSVALAMEVN